MVTSRDTTDVSSVLFVNTPNGDITGQVRQSLCSFIFFVAQFHSGLFVLGSIAEWEKKVGSMDLVRLSGGLLVKRSRFFF
jgi:choline-glycine betaine transporter